MTNSQMPLAHLSEETLVDYKAHFDVYDPDGKGKISVTDVPCLLRKVGLMPSILEIDMVPSDGLLRDILYLSWLGLDTKNLPVWSFVELIMEVDKDKNSALEGIDFSQFCTIAARKYNDIYTENDIINAFRVFDLENNGFISSTELRRAMCEMGEKLTEDEMNALVDNAPIDSDGNVLYEQFVHNMMADIHY